MKSLRQKSRVPVLLVGAALLSPALGIGAQNSAIDEAKAVVKSHEGFVEGGNLEGILSNVAEDIVVLTNDTPLIKGKAALRELYTGMLKTGAFKLGHDYEGAAVVADTVVLHGVARGTFTPPGGQPSAFANNFMLILKRQPNGKFQLWRIAFAPSGGS